MQHAYPLDDIEDLPEPTADEVRAQVADWLERLEALAASIKAWAKEAGWTIEASDPLLMHEERMRRAGLPPEKMDRFIMVAPGGGKVWFWPRALWAYGGNGQVNLATTKGIFMLVDRAESMAPPRWVLYRLGKGEPTSFEPSQIAELV